MSKTDTQKLYKYLEEDQVFKDTFKKLIDDITAVTDDKEVALSALLGLISNQFNDPEKLIATLESIKFISLVKFNIAYIQMLQKTSADSEKNPLAA